MSTIHNRCVKGSLKMDGSNFWKRMYAQWHKQGRQPSSNYSGERSACHPTLQATQGQTDSFSGQPPYKCHRNRVASVGDCDLNLPLGCLQGGVVSPCRERQGGFRQLDHVCHLLAASSRHTRIFLRILTSTLGDI
jgi:hypothetical protein